MSETEGRVLDWDDEIEADGSDFTLLPDGEYPFIVTDLERERHAGSAKLPPCPKAVVYLRVDGGAAGSTTIKHNLFLHSKTEGLLCEFFRAIGQRTHGEKAKMDWSSVVGSTGRARIATRSWTGDDGEERQSNQVKKFIDADQAGEKRAFTPGQF